MLAEIKTLFWLQWKLTAAMFRSTRLSVRWRLLGLIVQVIMFVFTIPFFVAMGGGLMLTLMLLSSRAAYELALLVNTLMLLTWLVLPASYNSELMERFEMPRLFAHPVSFGGIIVGSTLMSMLTMTGFWTVPVILGEIIGLAWHAPLALPVIAIGALSAFAALTLAGRLMDDVFDLVAGDRRLRAFLLTALMLPFMLCGLGQFLLPVLTDNYKTVPEFLRQPHFEALLRSLEAFGHVNTFEGFWTASSKVLETLGASHWLAWFPGNWGMATMGLAANGDWLPSLGFLGLSLFFVAFMLWVHAAVTRRLMRGVAVGVGSENVRSEFWVHSLPGPSMFWALFRKDWINLWRNPLPRWLMIPSFLVAGGIMLSVWIVDQSETPVMGQNASQIVMLMIALTTMTMMISLSLTANYYGTIDREGFAVLALAPVDARYILLSSNLTVWLYAALQVIILSLGIALATQSWEILPVGVILGLCLQIGGAPAYNLAAILGPYRANLSFTKTDQRGNIWGLVAWVLSAPPVLALVGLPYIFWKPSLLFTLPLCILYSLGLYALTIKPLGRLLQSRSHAIFVSVLTDA